jgi:PEGA domain
MNTAPDPSAPASDGGKRLATWYAQGHSDGLGDRLLMFDNTTAPSWEILRFKTSLARDPKFETALRHRVERLSTFQHPAFPVVRPITELGHEDGLAVVSTYATGVSISEGLKKPRSASFAVRLLRQVVPALAALQQHAPGIAHGALTVDRLILTADGRLMIREHMVGSAVDSLQLSRARLWADFNLLAPPSSSNIPALDERCDVVQVALVVLSLMAGRRIGPDEYPERTRDLLEEIGGRVLWQEPELFASLRRWLERALQIDAQPFRSASDANAALGQLQDQPVRTDDSGVLQLTPKRTPIPEGPPPLPALPSGALNAAREKRSDAAIEPPRVRRRDFPVIVWASVAVGVLAIGEAVFIGRLLYPASAEADAGPPAGVASIQANGVVPAARPHSDPVKDQPRLTPPPSAGTHAPPNALPALTVAKPAPELVETEAAPAKNGGFRVSAPIELYVLAGERLLGSSADGPIIAPAGRHEFEFVNSVIGIRIRQVVNVRPGSVTTVAVSVPNGTLNVNAMPWAAVWIDGTSYGETPLGNLSLVPGEHEIVFRHPQLGERREKALVRADTTTRVAVLFK